MDAKTQGQLLDLNRSFYEHFAGQFAGSRSSAQASLRHILAEIADGMAVLDVGCGDGRVARAIEQMGRRVRYLGVDASESFVALARARSETLLDVTAAFACVDVASQDWPLTLPCQELDVVLSLAVLHHIPGLELRQQVVQQMATFLAPCGRLIISTWQFMSSERLRRKIIPWAAIGLKESEVDPGDYLLDWQRGGYGLRYCHLVDEGELRSLCLGAGLAVGECYVADNGLNLYMVAQPKNCLPNGGPV